MREPRAERASELRRNASYSLEGDVSVENLRGTFCLGHLHRSIRTDRRRIVDVVRMSTGCLCRDVYTLQLYTHDDRCAVRAVSHHPSSLPITARLRRPTVRTSSLLGGRALWALRIAPARVLCGRLMRSTSLHGREGRQMEAAAWRPPCRCS